MPSGAKPAVYALVNASHVGWGSTRTIAELGAAGMLLIAFVVTEQRHRTPPGLNSSSAPLR